MLFIRQQTGTTSTVDIAAACVESGLHIINAGGNSGSRDINHNVALWDSRLRWRATNPGTRPVTRFTRNTDVESSPTGGRHIPWSFKGPAEEPGEPGVGTPMHYFRRRRMH